MWFYVAYNACVRDGAASGYVMARDEKYGVSAFVAITNTLGQAAEFVGHGMGPDDVGVLFLMSSQYWRALPVLGSCTWKAACGAKRDSESKSGSSGVIVAT